MCWIAPTILRHFNRLKHFIYLALVDRNNNTCSCAKVASKKYSFRSIASWPTTTVNSFVASRGRHYLTSNILSSSIFEFVSCFGRFVSCTAACVLLLQRILSLMELLLTWGILLSSLLRTSLKLLLLYAHEPCAGRDIWPFSLPTKYSR